MSKINLHAVHFTAADAAEALETIAWLERDQRGKVPAVLMYVDPHVPPTWWHVREMLNLTLLARTVAAQEGTAPSPGNPFPLGYPQDPAVNRAALLRLKARLERWKEGLEHIPPAVLPTYEGQTWIDIDKLDYRFDRPEPHPDPGFREEIRLRTMHQLNDALEAIHPTDEVVHGYRCHICYDESDLNIRITPDYFFAKDVPGPGIVATGPYLTWVVGKPPDFVLEMASPRKARADLLDKREQYQNLGIGEYWRLDPTGGDLYGVALAADRLEGGVYEPIAMRRLENGNIWGRSESAEIDIGWFEGGFECLGPGSGK